MRMHHRQSLLTRMPGMHPRSVALPSRRAMVQGLFGLALLPSARSANAPLSLPTAINRTARFRALSQRTAKAYCQSYLNVLPEQAKAVLGTAQKLFDSGFADLARANLSSDLVKQVLAVQIQVNALRDLVARSPSKEQVGLVNAQADNVLTLADGTTQALEGLSKNASLKLVNLAGRQRMLSQRLAKNYFLLAANFNQSVIRDQLKADANAFKQALATLKAAPISTVAIRNELDLGQSQWVFFESAISRRPDTDGLGAVATTSERLLEVMNNLTGYYDDALRDILG